MVAQKQTPLAVVRDRGRLRHDLRNGQPILLPQRHVDARHQRKVECHLALVPIPKVGPDIIGPHVRFSQDHAVFVLGIDGRADLLDHYVRLGHVLAAGAVAFDQVWNGIEA